MQMPSSKICNRESLTIGLSSYLILVGIYGSAISVSEDSMLRKSIRKLVIKEAELVDTFPTAQMEQEIQTKVVETTKRLIFLP
jgi:hypothetical protein